MKLAFVFVVIGFGTKAGFAPLHTWLPDAHSQAPSPISALLSGVLLNCALYGILRLLADRRRRRVGPELRLATSCSGSGCFRSAIARAVHPGPARPEAPAGLFERRAHRPDCGGGRPRRAARRSTPGCSIWSTTRSPSRCSSSPPATSYSATARAGCARSGARSGPRLSAGPLFLLGAFAITGVAAVRHLRQRAWDRRGGLRRGLAWVGGAAVGAAGGDLRRASAPTSLRMAFGAAGHGRSSRPSRAAATAAQPRCRSPSRWSCLGSGCRRWLSERHRAGSGHRRDGAVR